MRKVINVALIMVLVLVALVQGAILIGRQVRGATHAFLGLDTCRLPCWNGISLGETTIREAREIITKTYGKSNVAEQQDIGPMFIIDQSSSVFRAWLNFRATQSQTDTDTVSEIQIWETDYATNLSLWELIAFLGTPSYISSASCTAGDIPAIFYDDRHIQVNLYHTANGIISPDQKVLSLMLYKQSPEAGCFENLQSWKGIWKNYSSLRP